MTFIQMPINKSAAAKRLATIGDNRGSSDFGLGGRPLETMERDFRDLAATTFFQNPSHSQSIVSIH